MLHTETPVSADVDTTEIAEWKEAFDDVIEYSGPERAAELLQSLLTHAAQFGVSAPLRRNTPYVNTIPADAEVPYPGDRLIERRIKSMIRWNAAAMVARANHTDASIGGHISTYASLATLVEVGFNHFFRARIEDQPGDFVYFQGHASPGIYARAFLEGRLSEQHLEHFRNELRDDHPGLSSYPHPWLMPDFWQFPTVSMGLGPLNAIYHARFMRYMEHRGIIPASDRKVWAYLGDGEMDEPESQGALTVASREKLDNLIFVINCNLQRLDGPVRGNASIVQEMEALFLGAGWNVVKVLWGGDYDDLLARDTSGVLLRRMQETVDGEYQNYKVRGGAFIRKEFFGRYPELAKLVEHLSDEQLSRLRRGGHDPVKVYNAYRKAVDHRGAPTVILAKTIKGYGMGEAGEARNTAHNQKKLKEEQLAYLNTRFDLGIPEDKIRAYAFFKPAEDSPEMQYLRERREALGGPLPARNGDQNYTLPIPSLDLFKDSLGGSNGREVSTTGAYVAILRNLLRDKQIGKYIVPIVPDEMRTFGMESLIREVAIYASTGQLYTPVDSDNLLYYREAQNGQILEEGITEAGAMGSFTAAGTAYANFGVPMIPFYTYYSQFGFQRVGDFVWAFADSRGKGFLVGGTAGRTTLAGEGLQHQDGHTHVLFSVVPNCVCYDPAYAYEIAVIVQDGIRRMYGEKEDVFYYLTVMNENYVQPPMPEGGHIREGILKGLYRFKAAEQGPAVLHLFGSGAILNEAVQAQQILAEKYQVAADVWSVTSYVELRRNCLEVDRWNRLHPTEPEKTSYLQDVLKGVEGPIIAASDYMKVLPDALTPWLGNRLVGLGTDGFGRSDNRAHLRKHFEVDAASIAAAALSRLARDGRFDAQKAAEAMQELGVNADKQDPAKA